MIRLKKFINSRPHLPYIAPISIWLIVFVIGPLVVIFYFSLLKTSITGQITNELTFANYRALIEPNYLAVLFRTLLYAFLTNTICLFVGYPLAFWIVKYSGKWKNIFLLMVILPSWTCYLIRIYALRTLIAHNGMINSVLLNLNIISEPIDIMYTPLIVIIGLIMTWLPFMVLPIYASLEGLDNSLLEASLDLGATPFERFRTITLPLTKGGIFAGTILVFIPSLGEWLIPALLGGAKIMLAGNLVTLHFITAGNIPAGSCIATVLTAIIILIVYFFTKLGGEETLERIV